MPLRPPRLALAATAVALVAPLIAAPAFAQGPPASPAPPAPGPAGLTKVMSFPHQVTGVNVSRDGRIFVNFPRWTEDSALSVGEVKDGTVVPYPDAEWNGWRNALKDKVEAKTHWVCVQSIVVDHSNHLWVLDPAAPAMGALVPGGAKLVAIDLATDKVVKTIPFSDTVAPQGSYLNDVRFSPDDKVAYITDSGAKGALVVVDLTSGSARRVLDGDPSTQPDKSVTVTWDGKPLRRPDGRGVEFSADGIALSPDGKTLYWQAIKGKTLYSLPTAALNPGVLTPVTPEAVGDGGLRGKIATVGDNGPADGLIISRHDGKMYVTGPGNQQRQGPRPRQARIDADDRGGGRTGCTGPTPSRRGRTARSTSRPRTSRIPPSSSRTRRSPCRRNCGGSPPTPSDRPGWGGDGPPPSVPGTAGGPGAPVPRSYIGAVAPARLSPRVSAPIGRRRAAIAPPRAAGRCEGAEPAGAGGLAFPGARVDPSLVGGADPRLAAIGGPWRRTDRTCVLRRRTPTWAHPGVGGRRHGRTLGVAAR